MYDTCMLCVSSYDVHMCMRLCTIHVCCVCQATIYNMHEAMYNTCMLCVSSCNVYTHVYEAKYDTSVFVSGYNIHICMSCNVPMCMRLSTIPVCLCQATIYTFA